jgi:hypothetical protein
MKLAVMGSGAIGGYIGPRLAAAGAEVIFMVRGAHLGGDARPRALGPDPPGGRPDRARRGD